MFFPFFPVSPWRIILPWECFWWKLNLAVFKFPGAQDYHPWQPDFVEKKGIVSRSLTYLWLISCREKQSSFKCSSFLCWASDNLAFGESGISIRKVNTLNKKSVSFVNAVLFYFKCAETMLLIYLVFSHSLWSSIHLYTTEVNTHVKPFRAKHKLQSKCW